MIALARRHGWQFAKYDTDLTARFQYHPFGDAASVAAQYVVRGTYRGYQMVAFHHVSAVKVEVNGQRKSMRQDYGVVALSTPRHRPAVQVQQESARTKARGFFGGHDLQLESDEFNRAFLIHTESDRFAYDILHPRMMEWMLADPRTRQQPFRFEGNHLVLWQSGRLQPEWVVPTLDYACDILDQVPAYVWSA